ncbi:hypothetical protein GQ54DRAFT_11935 [Martensiomyces pterosporus]|nr:hypothetical protein GQ54DRAFT_11935 [Martensiomyces pterosporus]
MPLQTPSVFVLWLTEMLSVCTTRPIYACCHMTPCVDSTRTHPLPPAHIYVHISYMWPVHVPYASAAFLRQGTHVNNQTYVTHRSAVPKSIFHTSKHHIAKRCHLEMQSAFFSRANQAGRGLLARHRHH